MIIRIKTKNEIIWPLVIMYILNIFFLDSRKILIISLFAMLYYFLKIGKIVFPRIPMFIGIVLVLVTEVIMGLTKNVGRMIIRDLFYASYAFVMILFGYYLYYVYNDSKSIWKTIVFMSFIVSIIVLINGIPALLSNGMDFHSFREKFSSGVTGCSLLFSLMIFKRFFRKEKTLGKWIDIIAIITFATQIILNLSRTALLNTITTFTLMLLISMYRDNETIKVKNIYKGIIVVVITIISFSAIMTYLPDDTRENFETKIENSFTEINAGNDYNNVFDAMKDWRGYEIKCAKEQWGKSGVLEQLIGNGFGTLIKIDYIPGGWKDVVEKQNGYVGISILHNSFYSLLVKGGVVTVIVIILFFILNIIKGIKQLGDVFLGEHASILIICSVIILMNAYIIMELFGRGGYIGTLILVGWINAEINENKTILGDN